MNKENCLERDLNMQLQGWRAVQALYKLSIV